jgi:integrase/recombinase XerD
VATVNWEHYPRVAVHHAARAFIESLVKRQKAPKTIDAYARNLEDLLCTWPGAPERLVEATAADIDTYLESLATRARVQPAQGDGSAPDRHLSNATIQQRLVTTRLFFDFCLQRHLRQDPINPVPRGSWRSHRPRRGLLASEQRLPWLPTDAEWRAIVTDLFVHEPLRNQVLVLLAYDAALRRQELLGLRLDDVDWALGLVHVRAEHAKGGRARRVPISAPVERLLRHYVHTDRAHLLAGFGGEVAGPLFLSQSPRNPAQPLRAGAFNDILDRIRARLDLPQLHPHTFRHLRCTMLKRGGLDLDDIALFAGHASTSSTQLYVHLAPQELAQRLREAMAPFDQLLARLIAEHADGL